jgi:hypothetical protein
MAELYDLIKHTQVDSGVCMCGDYIKDHNQSSGHSPVDVWDYAVEQVDKGGTSEAFILRKQAEAVQASREALEDETVGTARRCGYDRDITYCDFEVDEVPIGTKLYTRPASSDVSEETLTAIHDTLRLVWSRELSADDGMDEIEILIPPPRR